MLTYQLPKELIAQTPCEPRDAARLLVLDRKSGGISHRIFRDLSEYLKPGDCLVLNDTKVFPARLRGRKAVTGGQVELLLLSEGRPEGEKARVYRCLGQPAKNLKPGTRLEFGQGRLHAQVLGWEEGERLVRFEGRGVEQTLAQLGEMPLPPYIGRPAGSHDSDWYQTVYAKEAGAVAAPTAGLHFTPELLEKIRQMGVRVAFVTLHVGWGTFKPVGEKELTEGKLHPERFSIPRETAQAIEETKTAGNRVVAVGTTVVRALETWATASATGGSVEDSRRPSGQGVPRKARDERGRMKSAQSLAGALRAFRDGPPRDEAAERVTDLFIRPGFQFRVVDALVTNFHLPGTSLLLLVSAFAGEEPIRKAYQEAVKQKYRFYSYGDAMLIL